MKKFIISFFSILLIALASIGGGLLLSACDNSSYSENVGEGIGDSTNEDVNTPSDGPNDENENSGSEESNSNLDDGVSALAVSLPFNKERHIPMEMLKIVEINLLGIVDIGLI